MSDPWMKAAVEAAVEVVGCKEGELKGTYSMVAGGKWEASFLFTATNLPVHKMPGVGKTVEAAVIDALLTLKTDEVNELWRGR